MLVNNDIKNSQMKFMSFQKGNTEIYGDLCII